MATSMMTKSQQIVESIVGMIFEESIRCGVSPETVLRKVREVLDNKMKCVRAANPADVTEMVGLIQTQMLATPSINCRHEVYALGEWNVPVTPKKIIYSGNRTIVFWNDGTKTVVKLGRGQEFDEYLGFIAAYAKKMFGNNSRIKKLIKSVGSRPDNKKAKNSD